MLDIKDVKNGIICFTFDDRNFEGWINSIPLFDKYNAHASFFVSGEMDENAISTMKTLAEHGHTLGLHTLDHASAIDFFNQYGAERYYGEQIKGQLQKCKDEGLNIKTFAYPNNQRNSDTDKFLKQYFNRFRAGVTNIDEKDIYIPVKDICSRSVMHGFGIGAFYNTKECELVEKIKRVADENICLTFYSHDIKPNADHINMPTDLLEKCLMTASELGVILVGFDEIQEV